jgi:Domain of unknown function (DUF4956)
MALDWLFNGDFGAAPTDTQGLWIAFLLAFLGGHLIGYVYMVTHTGLSYSRSFVNSIMVLPAVVGLVMMVMANNLLVAFGMMAVFAIVRFRNILRDSLDATYLLTAIAFGMACGTRKFATGISGVGLIVAYLGYLSWTSFGSRHRYDTILNFHWNRPLVELSALTPTFERHTLRAMQASQRSLERAGSANISYRILMRDPARQSDLLNDLGAIPGISRLSSLDATDESEV